MGLFVSGDQINADKMGETCRWDENFVMKWILLQR